MLRVLHVVRDLPRFVGFVDELFSTLDEVDNSYFIGFSMSHRFPALPSKLRSIENFRSVTWLDLLSGRVSTFLSGYDVLLIHYMAPAAIRLLAWVPRDVTVVWSGWGADYASLFHEGEDALLGAETRRAWSKPHDTADRLRAQVRKLRFLPRLLRDSVLSRGWPEELIRRIDFFSAPIPEEYDRLREVLGKKFRARYMQLNYGSVERTFRIGPHGLTGQNVLVGNSATPTNNHLDVFRILSRVALGERRIVVPLSYGEEGYRDLVLREGEKRFGERFQPLVKYVPLDEYNALICTCSVAVMGHKRQQALGNICTLLYRGARVFLDSQSTTYQFFKARGADVFSLEALERDRETILSPLTEEQVARNRRVLQEFWGQDVVEENVHKLVQALEALRG